MEDLYQICDYYYSELLKGKSNLSFVKQVGVVKKDEEIIKFLKEIQLRLAKGQCNLNSLIFFCNFGDVLNMDLLTEVLMKFKYSDYFKTSCKMDEDTNKTISSFYNEEYQNIIELTNKMIIIDTMISNLVIFIRNECDEDFLRTMMYVKLYQYDKASSYMNKLRYIANKILNNSIFYINEVSSSEKLIECLNKKILYKDDIVSELVDDYSFIEIIINELNMFKEELNIAKEKIAGIKTICGFERDFYLRFIEDLVIVFEERIRRLDSKKIEKVIIKKYSFE